MIDSHCHLNFKSLSKDLPNIIKRCKKNNVTRLLSINTKPEDYINHLDLIKDYNNIYISYGIHPEEINNDSFLSSSDIEKNIKSISEKARNVKLTIDDLQGGTFTISNGGVYGSMLSTPILNPPQSGVLGMHNIVDDVSCFIL